MWRRHGIHPGVRRETFSFWDEVRSQFTHDSARGEMERRMKAVSLVPVY